MNSVTETPGGFDKVVFESVIDTLAGGITVDVTGYDDTDNPGIIPAGTMVGAKDNTTGLAPIVGLTGTAGTLDGDPIGLTHATIKLVVGGNNLVGVVLEGVARKAALPFAPASADLTTMRAAMPKITLV